MGILKHISTDKKEEENIYKYKNLVKTFTRVWEKKGGKTQERMTKDENKKIKYEI